MQALEKWGNWGQIAPGVSNGQSEIKFTKLEFARPETVAAQFDPDEGFTGVCAMLPLRIQGDPLHPATLPQGAGSTNALLLHAQTVVLGPFAGLIQAVIFEVNDRDLIGYPTPTGYRYCCTKELVPKTKCFQDRLIYQVCLVIMTHACPPISHSLRDPVTSPTCSLAHALRAIRIATLDMGAACMNCTTQHKGASTHSKDDVQLEASSLPRLGWSRG